MEEARSPIALEAHAERRFERRAQRRQRGRVAGRLDAGEAVAGIRSE